MKRLIALLLLLTCTILCLASCVAGDPAETKARMEEAGYTVTASEESSKIEDMLYLFGISGAGIRSVVLGFDEESDCSLAFVCAMYAEDRDTAKYLEADCRTFIDEDLEELLRYGTAGGYTAEDFCVKRQGKIVLFGLEDMVKAAS